MQARELSGHEHGVHYLRMHFQLASDGAGTGAPTDDLAERIDIQARAAQIMESVPRMHLIDALKFAMATDPHQESKWEYGLPNDWDNNGIVNAK